MYSIGQGTDFHKIIKSPQETMSLGGFKFHLGHKVIAHSDGDVILHSISNAILGATQSGDIGEHFSDTDENIKNIDSKDILNFCLNKLNGHKILNLDLTIQCENIMLTGIKSIIKNNLIKLLNCPNINVKATRFEQPSDLIACHSVILIE